MSNMEWPDSTKKILELLDITHPIIQAPMAGGITTPELVSAVSECGAVGSIGAGYLTPAVLDADIQKVLKKTKKPFNVGLFITGAEEFEYTHPREVVEELEKYADELNIALNTSDIKFPKFEEQLEIVIDNKVPIFSFTFGIPDRKYIDELKRNNIRILGTATSVAEAFILQDIGS